MYIPSHFTDPVEEYWHLVNHVTVWDVGCERQLEIRGPDGGKVKFEIDPFRKHCLMNGLDDIGLTLENGGAIEQYETGNKFGKSWLWK